MDENTIFIMLIVALVVIIATGLPIMIVISREIDSQIYKCEKIKRWAKHELDLRQRGEEHETD